jgi:hypothetical protein
MKITKVSAVVTPKNMKHLPAYDHTALSSINVCPTWGIIRYVEHLRMPGEGRAMALEAGSAGHEIFAACRWFQFDTRSCLTVLSEIKRAQSDNLGIRLFGENRFEQMLATQSKTATERTNLMNFCLEALYSCGFYDDPYDKYRTVNNIAETGINWLDRYDLDKNPLWIRDVHDSNTDIGIEIAFDIIVTIEYEEDEQHKDGVVDSIPKQEIVRYCGKLDGLHWDSKGSLRVEEDKTGNRLDDAWLAQWQMSHQITGYCVAASAFTDQQVLKAKIRGMKIPLGRDIMAGVREESVSRNELMVNKWAVWLMHTISCIDEYKRDLLNIPQYTTSCSRYFRPCSFLPLCTCPTEEEKLEVLSEMTHDKWSPLDE